jgi:hypothetical protein
MNFCGMIACGLVGTDCLSRANGLTPQSLFGAGAEWLWYVIAILWFWTAAMFFLRMLGAPIR